MRSRLTLSLVLCCLALTAAADVFQPTYLELRELGNDRYEVIWKEPMPVNGVPSSVRPVLPAGTIQISESVRMAIDSSWVERWQVSHAGGLAGKRIAIRSDQVDITEVIARVERMNGSSQVERLSVTHPEFIVEGSAAGGAVVGWSYLVLGVEHILGGLDHLLFVLALLLVARGSKSIIVTVTAFTVSHSVTLVATTLGWVRVPGPPVEVIIALSIVFVATEIIHELNGKPGLTSRAPWVVALSFGLLHGFGFANALAEVGLPQTAIALALLMFNVGVEVGQLLFVCAVLGLREVFRVPSEVRRQAAIVGAYGIGSLAAYWTLDRIANGWF